MKKFLLTCAVLGAISFPALAQVQVQSRDNKPSQESVQPNLPVELVEKLSRAAHDALPQGKTSDGQIIGERAKTLSYPLVPLDVREKTIVRGYLAGYAKWCSLDWQNQYFLPFMSDIRAANPSWDDFRYAYIGILHGMSMTIAENSKQGQTCSDADKKKVLDQLAR